MRDKICKSLIEIAKNKQFVFFTGDLGYAALEPLREVLGKNFINAGVSEQNMVSVAAGVAYTGTPAFVYSIAPFCYARPFEQIRNDVCFQNAHVILVGNGGGYAYGSMGATHHALEDYGVLACLPNMHIYVPAFSHDIKPILEKIMNIPHPGYLRLGRCELPNGARIPEYAAWRCLIKGGRGVLVCMGPFVGGILAKLMNVEFNLRPELWVVTELPLLMGDIPQEFIYAIQSTSKLFVAEEHVKNGGLAQNLLLVLSESQIPIPAFKHIYALGYPSSTYGSQQFHRKQCGLDPDSILAILGL